MVLHSAPTVVFALSNANQCYQSTTGQQAYVAPFLITVGGKKKAARYPAATVLFWVGASRWYAHSN